MRFPDKKLSVIILGNVTPISIDTPLPVVDTTTATPNNTRKENKKSSLDDAKQYLGSFYSEELDVTYYMTEKNNQVFCSIKNRQPFALQAESQDLFTTGTLEVKFDRDSKNQVSGFSIYAGRVENMKFRRVSTSSNTVFIKLWMDIKNSTINSDFAFVGILVTNFLLYFTKNQVAPVRTPPAYAHGKVYFKCHCTALLLLVPLPGIFQSVSKKYNQNILKRWNSALVQDRTLLRQL